MPYRLLQKILSYTATPISKVLLFLMSITYSTFLFSQDSIPISLPVNIDSSTSTITVIDTIAHSNRNDSLKNDKKEYHFRSSAILLSIIYWPLACSLINRIII